MGALCVFDDPVTTTSRSPSSTPFAQATARPARRDPAARRALGGVAQARERVVWPGTSPAGETWNGHLSRRETAAGWEAGSRQFRNARRREWQSTAATACVPGPGAATHVRLAGNGWIDRAAAAFPSPCNNRRPPARLSSRGAAGRRRSAGGAETCAVRLGRRPGSGTMRRASQPRWLRRIRGGAPLLSAGTHRRTASERGMLAPSLHPACTLLAPSSHPAGIQLASGLIGRSLHPGTQARTLAWLKSMLCIAKPSGSDQRRCTTLSNGASANRAAGGC